MALLGRSYTIPIIRQGDPTAAPPVGTAPQPTPVIVSAQPQLPRKPAIVLTASVAADAYYAAAQVVPPQRVSTVVPVPIIVTGDKATAAPDLSGPLAKTVVVPAQRQLPTPAGIIRQQNVGGVTDGALPAQVFVGIPQRRDRGRFIKSIGAPDTAAPGTAPSISEPTTLALNVHANTLTLNAHTNTMALGIHTTTMTLGAHSNTATLRAHSNTASLNTHSNTATLNAHSTSNVLRLENL